MKIHFSWTISAKKSMELESKIMIASSQGINCHHTIWVQEKEYDQIDPKLKRIAEIATFKPNEIFATPWTITPKWNIQPQGDVVIGIDADVMVWNENSVIAAAEECLENKKLYGTIGYFAPFPISEWHKMFNRYKMDDNFIYEHTNSKEKTPYYINYGVVMMPKENLTEFKKCYDKWLIEINKWHHDCYFLCQIANTFAIKELQTPVVAMPRTFNYTEVDNPNLPMLDKAAFLHYNKTRIEIESNGISSITNLKIKNRISKLLNQTLL